MQTREPEYRVILPISFEACYHIPASEARDAEHAAAIAIARYEAASDKERINRIGGGLLCDQDGDGGVIGKPYVDDPE